MKAFTYSEARQNLARLLILAQKEEVEIRRRDGSVFSLKVKKTHLDHRLMCRESRRGPPWRIFWTPLVSHGRETFKGMGLSFN